MIPRIWLQGSSFFEEVSVAITLVDIRLGGYGMALQDVSNMFETRLPEVLI